MIEQILNRLQPSGDMQYLILLIAICAVIWMLRPMIFRFFPSLIAKKAKLDIGVSEGVPNDTSCECNQVETLKKMQENLEDLSKSVDSLKLSHSEIRASLLRRDERQNQVERQIEAVNAKLDKVIDNIIDLSGKVGR